MANLILWDTNREVWHEAGTARQEPPGSRRLVGLTLFLFALVARHGHAGFVALALSVERDDVAARGRGLVHGGRVEVRLAVGARFLHHLQPACGLLHGGGSRTGRSCVAGLRSLCRTSKTGGGFAAIAFGFLAAAGFGAVRRGWARGRPGPRPLFIGWALESGERVGLARSSPRRKAGRLMDGSRSPIRSPLSKAQPINAEGPAPAYTAHLET
jgi:hypothetical protein